MADPNLSAIVTTTLKNRTPKIADNTSNNNALLFRLKQKGRLVLFSGGVDLNEPLDYDNNGTYKRYSGEILLSLAT
jgi:hypothetical protein